MNNKEKVLYWFYNYGWWVGNILIFLPIGRDILLRGGREFNFISIGIVGVCIQIAGLICLWLAYYGESNLDKKTKPGR